MPRKHQQRKWGMIWFADFRSQQGGEKSGRETGRGQKTTGISEREEKKKTIALRNQLQGFVRKQQERGESAGNWTQSSKPQEPVPAPQPPCCPDSRRRWNREDMAGGQGDSSTIGKSSTGGGRGAHSSPISRSGPTAQCPLLPLGAEPQSGSREHLRPRHCGLSRPRPQLPYL